MRRNVVGNSSRWSGVFPPNLIPKILQLVVVGWDSFDMPSRDELEVRIARRFRSHLRQLGEQRRLPVAIDREIPEDDDDGEEKGRIDIRFLHGYRTNIYFVFECKRLNVPKGRGRSTLAPEYVREGISRFVTGQYARSVLQSGMIGFVMDGKSDEAVALVDAAVTRMRREIRLRRPHRLSASLIRPRDGRIKETYHTVMQGTFRLHHIFLAVA